MVDTSSVKDRYNSSPQFVKTFIDNLIKVEGGYGNDPSDSGGETKYGITQETSMIHRYSWKDYGWDGDMKTLPIEFAQDIYAQGYFYDAKFDIVAYKSELIAEELFDSGVHMGVEVPSKWLQEFLNLFNNRQQYYPDIAEDGIIGKKTVSALQSFLNKRGVEGEEILHNALNSEQSHFYKKLSQKREKDEKFYYGWLKNRVLFKGLPF